MASQRAPARIQVSHTRKPVAFYVSLAKRLLAEHGDIELSALGLAASSCVTVSEILKKDGLATVTRVNTGMDYPGGGGRAAGSSGGAENSAGNDSGGNGRLPPEGVLKPKIEITMRKTAQLDRLAAEGRLGAAAEPARPGA